jgi:hypothetical protein
MAKKIKFAAPLPENTPGPKESQERFMERMAAHGNRDALDKMREFLDRGHTFAEYRETK